MTLEQLVKEAAQTNTSRGPVTTTAVIDPPAVEPATGSNGAAAPAANENQTQQAAAAEPTRQATPDDQAQPVKERPNVEVEVATKKRRRQTDQAEDGQSQGQAAPARSGLVAVKQAHQIDHAHGAVSLIIASIFGLLFVGRAWLFGAETTVEFIIDWLGWSVPVDIPLDLESLHLKLHIELMWLFPIGLTFYQIVHRPPLTFKGIMQQFHRDPAGSSLWLMFTGVGIGTTFGGLILWAHDRHWIVGPRIVLQQWPILMLIFYSALAVEYLAEPFAIKFWAELRNGFKALHHKWDAEPSGQATSKQQSARPAASRYRY
jgi:hypothetical protein